MKILYDFQTLDVVDKELCKIHHNRIFRNWKEGPPKKGDVTLLSSSKQRKGIKAAYLEAEAVGLLFVKKHPSAIQSYSRSKPARGRFLGVICQEDRGSVNYEVSCCDNLWSKSIKQVSRYNRPKNSWEKLGGFQSDHFSKLLLLQIHFMAL